MKLAENLGELAQQIHEGNLHSIEVNVKGTLASVDTYPLQIAVLKGIFNSTDNVNYVNAELLAKNKGITVTTSKSDELGNYLGYIEVVLNTEKNKTKVAGAMIAKNIVRIVSIKKYNTSIETVSNMLLIPHTNKPSMIAKVATVIGQNGINIEHMHVVQKENDNSLMVINTDIPVEDNVLDLIKEIDGIAAAKYIKLTA